MDFSWLADVKELVIEGITYLNNQAEWLGVGVVVILFLALAARLADLDEIIKAWRSKDGEDE